MSVAFLELALSKGSREEFTRGYQTRTQDLRFEKSSPKEIDPTTRIVVIGMGAITPLGLNVYETWRNMINGKTGIKKHQYEEYPRIKASVAATVEGFNPQEILKGIYPEKEVKNNLHRSAQFALAATHEALIQAKLLIPNEENIQKAWKINGQKIDPDDISIIYGTGIGGGSQIGEVQMSLDAKGRAITSDILKALPERSAKAISMAYGIYGGAHSLNDACATGNKALSSAFQELACGDAKIVITGATEATCVPVGTAMFDVIRSLDPEPNPKIASRPLDQSAEGFVMGEGAATLVLTTLDYAKKIGAPILAELLSYKNTSDASNNVFPNGVGSEKAMRGALERAKIKGLGRTIYINGHLTATEGDKIEINALNQALGDIKKNVVGISATKSSTGHLLGAAGALEAIICIQTLRTGSVPPTLKLENPINEALDFNCVKKETQELNPETAMSNSFGFGGGNSVVIFQKT